MQSQNDPALRIALVFTALALGFASIYWLLIHLAQQGSLPFAMGPFDFSLEHSSIPGMLLAVALRVFGPAIAALITLYSFQGQAGVAALGRSLTRWRLPGWLYALAFFGSLAVGVVIAVLGLATGRLQFAPEQVHIGRFVAFFFLMLVFDGPLGEEIGWRGVLLPQLLRKMGPVGASFVVGCVWFVWHIPLYIADGKDLHPIGYFINVVALSYVFTWFYLKSGYSTWMTIFLHTSSNYALFLIIKSFHYANSEIASLQYLYDACIVVAAFAVTADFRKDWKRGQNP